MDYFDTGIIVLIVIISGVGFKLQNDTRDIKRDNARASRKSLVAYADKVGEQHPNQRDQILRALAHFSDDQLPQALGVIASHDPDVTMELVTTERGDRR
jgi:hypothetical protein